MAGDVLQSFVDRYMKLCAAQQEHDDPEPAPWRRLAADLLRWRSALGADDPQLLTATVLEEIISWRIDLEEGEPEHTRRQRSVRGRVLRVVRGGQLRSLRESRASLEQASAIRMTQAALRGA